MRRPYRHEGVPKRYALSPRTLRGQLALWTCAATFIGLSLFGVVAYTVVAVREQADADEGVPDDPAEVDTEARDEMLLALAVATPIGLALSFGAATWGGRRVMRTFDRFVDAAAEITVDRFDRRMEVPPPAHELRPLAEAINDLVTRLQRGYDALASFSADASHELRTPLAAVCSELEVNLRRPRSVGEWETSAAVSLAELRRLSGVVDAMLRFSQADATRTSDATRVDVPDVVDEVIAIHAKAAASGGVSLHATSRGATAGESIAVRGDAELLTTALSNLVGNAVRATPRGGRVEVAIQADASVGEIAIVIEDTGPGLPPDRSQLFEPFAKLGGAPDGVGLGLAIARRIVVRHGGELVYADRDCGGAAFTIRLPRAPA